MSGPTPDRVVSTARPTLTPRELALVVELLGKGWTLQRAIDRIQAERPTLPFTPEAA
jgi:hypothetical protein